MKRLYVILALMLLVSGLISGCGLSKEQTEAENVAASFFETVRNKDFDTAISFYSQEFFEKTSEEEWLQALENINVKLGDLESYELTHGETRKYYHLAEGKGTSCLLKYEVTYSKYVATEDITLFKPADGDEFKITAHNINSMGFLTD